MLNSIFEEIWVKTIGQLQIFAAARKEKQVCFKTLNIFFYLL